MNETLRTYRDATAPRPEDVERLRLAARSARPARAPWIGGAVAVAAAAAAWIAWPRAVEPRMGPIPEGASVLVDGVTVDLVGDASAVPTVAGTAVTLASGELAVEVTPDRGLDVAVTTPEAVVRVVGTGFTVRRALEGTIVTVRHGRVSVACVAGDTVEVGAGGEATCPVASPGLWLGRARALLDRHAPVAEVDAAVAAGRRVATPGSAIEAELTLVGVQARAPGDPAGALDALGGYLAAGATHRRAEAVDQGARLAHGLGGCARAEAWLAAVAPAEAAAAEAALGCR